MAKLVCLVVAVAMLGVASCHGVELQEGAAYRIQSVFDGGFLSVTSERQLCKPLSPVITSAESNGDGFTFYPNWWGNMELFGIHFDADRSMNSVTFEGGATCYPVYNSYDLTGSGPEKVVVRVKDTERCLTSNGLGQSVNFQTCDGTAHQVWNFARVERV